MLIKLSDFVADFLAQQGIKYAFVLTGGADIHLIDSIAKHHKIEHVCCLHEQACAMAADGFSRMSKYLGTAITTSGPGATNLITGICSAFYDSIPALFITGQVSTFRMKGTTGARQVGFQETDVVDICKPITKYAVLLTDPKNVLYELEKCCHIAKTGRPGPVLIDIPDNLQRVEIDPSSLAHFEPSIVSNSEQDYLNDEVNQCISLINNAHRPIVIFGHGVHSAHAENEAYEFIEDCGIPFALTWATADLFPSDMDLNVGTFGTHGTRYGNFAVQNADLIISIGSRLDTKATGSPPETFAREAKKIMVDIDSNEITKFGNFGLIIDVPICCDAKLFLQKILDKIKGNRQKSFTEWISKIIEWKKDFPICLNEYFQQDQINPYVFVKSLSKFCGEEETLVIDTGCTVAWMSQAFEFKKGQRMLHDWNNTAMGWALPAAIGASLALNRKQIICVMGDGSLYMNIQELATVIKQNLPIKIFVMNNNGYSMIQQTEEQWLDSRYFASNEKGGLPIADIVSIAKAYGFNTEKIRKNSERDVVLSKIFNSNEPYFCSVEVDPISRVYPQVKFGRPNEDTEPLLDRKTFLKNMIVKPLPISLEN